MVLSKLFGRMDKMAKLKLTSEEIVYIKELKEKYL